MWLRWVLIAVVLLPLLVCTSFAWRGFVSRQPSSRPDLGVTDDGRLQPCPDSPNCVCSQCEGDAHVDPLPLGGDPDSAVERIQTAISATGGEVDSTALNYVRARYLSAVFGFVDDVEFLVDPEAGVIHVRSASREGYSDLGANRKRVERIRAALAD